MSRKPRNLPALFLLCGLFDVSPLYWRWQLQVEDAKVEMMIYGERFRLGPPGTPAPTPAHYRAAALLALATGDHDNALCWAQAAGAQIRELQTELAALLKHHARRLKKIAAAIVTVPRDRQRWPGILAGIMPLGELAGGLEVWQLRIVDPAESARLEVCRKSVGTLS